MDFFENVKAVAKNTAQVVAQKSGEIAEATKTQYMIFELKGDVKKLYSEIGKLTYLAIEKDEDHTEDIRSKCDIVAAKLAKIEVLKAKEDATDSTDDAPVAYYETDVAEDIEDTEEE